MSTKIKGAEYPLSKIFSSDFEYEIPSYQRPYSWTEEETETLFNDLYEFYDTESDDENYFLGSIVLVKDDDKPLAEVIDGQQRLTTLTILLAAIAYNLDGEEKNDFKGYILEPGRPSQGLASKPRLKIRSRDNAFFVENVQSLNFERLLQLDPKNQDTEAKSNIIRNSKKIFDKLQEKCTTKQKIIEFGMFLVQRCFLVVVSTTSQISAFRVFSVMNSRGLDLQVTDIIKAELIGSIPEEKRNEYTDKWEEMEVRLGRAGFNDLFSHIRMIKMRTKAKKTLLEEFKKGVLLKNTGEYAMKFISDTLEPFSDAYYIVKNCIYNRSHSELDDSINDLLCWLNKIDNTDWVPVAMVCYEKYKDTPEKILDCFYQLERLAAFMRISSYDVNSRISRYGQILSELDNDELSSMKLTESEKDTFINYLNSDIYSMSANKRNYIILRLDSFVSDGSAKYKNSVLTIEHVLPQSVNPKSEWAKIWNDEEARNYWVNKIANLVPLAKRKNSSAQNYDFEIKKDKYFRGDTGTSAYALTTQVLNEKEWTPTVLQQRQETLLNIFKQKWDLNLNQ